MPYFMVEDGTRIYYKETGCPSGKPLIALHGWNSCHTMFDDLFAGMQDYRCIAPDFRGVNKSSLPKTGISMGNLARDTQALLDHLGLDKVYLLGYSMGASVIYKYVDLFGTDRLEKAIICDMSPKLLNDDQWHEGLGQGQADPMACILDTERMLDDYEAFYEDYFMKKDPVITTLPKAMKEKLGRGMRSINTDYVMACLYLSFLVQDYRPMLSKFDIPTALFFGDPGSIYQPKTAYYLAERMSGPTKVVLFENASHLFGMEYPEKLIQETRAFLER